MLTLARPLLALAAVISGAALGTYNNPKVETLTTSVVKPGMNVVSDLYASQVRCTFTWTGGDATVFVNRTCDPTPQGFTATPGFTPPRNKYFGVVCGLRDGDTFEIIASGGTSKDAGAICDGLTARGWDTDPALGSDFNTVLQERP